MSNTYLLWKDEMLLQFPFLKFMARVRWYPLNFCFLKKMPESYCELCAYPRRWRQVPGYFPDTQDKMQTNKSRRATSYMRLGYRRGGDFLWGLLYPVTILVIRVPHISLTEDWRSEFGYCRMFAGSQGVEKRSGSNYIQFRGMWGILMISITPVVTLGGGAH